MFRETWHLAIRNFPTVFSSLILVYAAEDFESDKTVPMTAVSSRPTAFRAILVADNRMHCTGGGGRRLLDSVQRKREIRHLLQVQVQRHLHFCNLAIRKALANTMFYSVTAVVYFSGIRKLKQRPSAPLRAGDTGAKPLVEFSLPRTFLRDSHGDESEYGGLLNY